MNYVTNGFSPSMLQKLPSDVEFMPITADEFCQVVNGFHVNAVGHQGTADLINGLCGSSLRMNRVPINALSGDHIYIVTLTTRLEEGKVLSREEIKHIYDEGKVKFIKAVIYGAVLSELSECEGKCNEMTYDSLAYRAKR